MRLHEVEFLGSFMDYHLSLFSGGETIRDINRISGARVELVREPSHNPHEKLFRIQGSPAQTDAAIRLIREKAGLVSIVILT